MPAPLVAAHSMETGLTRQEKNMLECFFMVLHSEVKRCHMARGNGRLMGHSRRSTAAGDTTGSGA